MWLINVSTLSLELFYGESIPKYAILSHTWEDEEVTFKEFNKAAKNPDHAVRQKAGYAKILAACARARRDEHQYVWVDTCCIDKTSSAELSEAINSMFEWYQQSEVCYAYLSDLSLHKPDATDPNSSSQLALDTALRKCRWFTRGWCLQELLAPRRLVLVNKHWRTIGRRRSLAPLISNITGVPAAVLDTSNSDMIFTRPIADRISWISKRQTTRIEDMSYSLLGILQVNMPMLYGEGHRAFRRLQEEVIKKYNDLSIFSWVGDPLASGFMPALARSPTDFPLTGDIEKKGGGGLGSLTTQFSITNQGITFPAAPLKYRKKAGGYRHHYFIKLDYNGGDEARGRLYLQKIGPGLFVRLHDNIERREAFRGIHECTAIREPVCILDNLTGPAFKGIERWDRYALRLCWKPWNKYDDGLWHIRDVEPMAHWDVAGRQFLQWIGPSEYCCVEFVPGTQTTNPEAKHFLLELYAGDASGSKFSIRTVTARVSRGDKRNRLPLFMFTGREAQSASSSHGGPASDANSNRITIAGYDISVDVRLVSEEGQQPYHLVYIDWEEAALTASGLASALPEI